MPAMELLCHIIGVNPHELSKEENLILEAELLAYLCNELKKLFKNQFKDYFRLMKYNSNMEDSVIDENFIRCIINDILSTETYTLPGIAFYTQTPEDIIYEIVTGKNTSPSLFLSRKIIELHKSIRRDLYKEILSKATTENSSLS